MHQVQDQDQGRDGDGGGVLLPGNTSGYSSTGLSLGESLAIDGKPWGRTQVSEAFRGTASFGLQDQDQDQDQDNDQEAFRGTASLGLSEIPESKPVGEDPEMAASPSRIPPGVRIHSPNRSGLGPGSTGDLSGWGDTRAQLDEGLTGRISPMERRRNKHNPNPNPNPIRNDYTEEAKNLNAKLQG